MKLKTLVKLCEFNQSSPKVFLYDYTSNSERELTATDYIHYRNSSILWWAYVPRKYPAKERDKIVIHLDERE